MTDRIADREIETLFSPLAMHGRWGLAVSGGRDSMALMHLAAHHARSRDAGPELTVLTVDHGLRPEAAREAAFVAQAAARLGLEHRTLRWEGEKPARGLQAVARGARYDLMAEHARRSGIDCLVTAHHLEDQAETVLMRLKRGSGPDGLAGIPAQGRWGGLPVYRPLLDVPRARLEATVRDAGLTWIEDPSNGDDRFERVRIRKAMGELERLGYPARALAITAARMRRAGEALDAATQSFLEAHAAMSPAGYCALDRHALAIAPEEIALRAVARGIEAVRCGAVEPGLARLETLMTTLRADDFRGATLGGCRFAAKEDAILVLREPGRRGLHAFGLAPGERRLWDRRFEVSSPVRADAPVMVRALGAQGARQLRSRAAAPVALPRTAAAALVSFWRGDELLAVPPLGFDALSGDGVASGLEARFVNAGLFTGVPV